MTTPFSTNILGEGTPQLRFNMDFSLTKWNTIGSHQMLSVTGLVRVKFYLYCTSSLLGGSSMEIGTTGTTNYFGTITPTDFDAGEIMCLNNNSIDTDKKASFNYQDRAIENLGIHDMVLSEDLELNIGAAALTGGILQFIGWWQKLSTDGGVAEGDGT